LSCISDQIRQHLLQLAGVAGDERKRGVEVQLDANFFRSRCEALQIRSASSTEPATTAFMPQDSVTSAQSFRVLSSSSTTRTLMGTLARCTAASSIIGSHRAEILRGFHCKLSTNFGKEYDSLIIQQVSYPSISEAVRIWELRFR
jgi:hypothetical protein